MNLIFDTHPIQYRSPVFRKLPKKDFHVVYFDMAFEGNRWWFHERGKTQKKPPPQQWLEGFSYESLSLNQTNTFIKFLKIQQVLKTHQPKAVITYGYYLIEHWLLWLLCLFHNIPLVFIGETFELKKNFLRDLFFSRVKKFISIGEKNYNFYLSLGIDPQSIHKTHYCVDEDFFKVDDKAVARKKWREKRNISPTAKVLLFVGRLFDRKRPFDLLTVLELISPHQECFAVFVGEGELFEVLRDKTKNLTNVRVLGGLSQNELLDCYIGSDLLFVPSEYETWGLVVNEAFCLGLPALVTENTGVAHDLVIPHETGWVCKTGDTKTMSESIRSAFSQPTLLQEMGKKANAKVQNYSTKHFAKVLLESVSF